jgi:hypothetical protein
MEEKKEHPLPSSEAEKESTPLPPISCETVKL